MKRIGLLILVAAVAVLVWTQVFQQSADPPPRPTSSETRRPLIALQPPQRNVSLEEKNVSRDDDPKGPLSLSGQVLDVNGAPAPGATVSIDANPPRYATTDARGWFFFEGLLGRIYYIEAKKDSAFVGPLSVDVNSIADPVELRLKDGSTLDVLVLHEETNQPLPSVKVVVSIITEYEAITDAKGVARFQGFGQNYASAYVSAPGFSQQRDSFDIKGVPGQVQQEVLYAKPGARVSGVVLDPEGRPLPGATVLATSISRDYALAEGDSATSDAEGKFEIGAVPAGGYRLYATHPEFRAALSDAFDVTDVPSGGHSLQLQSGSVVAGKVVDQQDKPVPFAIVTLSYERLSMNTTEYWDYKKSSREVYCDAAGAFSLEGVAPGNVELRSSAEELSEATLKFALQENEAKRDVVIVLDPGEEIAGRVVSDKGEPIPNAEVYASLKIDPKEQASMTYSYPRSLSAKSNAAGEFLLRGLEPGEYFLNAYTAFDASTQYREEYTPDKEPASYASGSRDVSLVLKRLDAISVKGNVLFEEGGVPDSFLVRVGAKEGNFKNNSSFLLEGVAVEYAYMISVEGPEFRTVQKDLKAEVGKDLDLGTIKVRRGRTIEGQVLNARGTPIAGATVSIVRDYEDDPSEEARPKPEEYTEIFYEKSARSDQNGRFSLSGIPTQYNLTVRATHPNKGSAKDLKLAKGATNANLNLTILDGGVITGKITRDGKPSRASVSLAPATPEDPAMYTPGSTSGGDGVYRLEHVPAGKYNVDFFRYTDEQSYGEPLVTKTITVVDGETLTLDVDLPVYPSLLVTLPSAKEEKGYWGFALLKGQHKPKTVAQVEEVVSKLYEANPESKGNVYYANDDFYTPGVQSKFVDILPGSYTVCLSFYPLSFTELEDGSGSEDYTKSPATCQPVQVSQNPEQQSLSISTP